LLAFFILLSANLEKIGQSTAEAFAAFYEQYLPKIFKYVCYRINDKFLAEDITAAVFEKALIKYQTYSSKKAAISTWLFTIARNTIVDHFRDAQRLKTVQLDDKMEIPQEARTPEQAFIDEEQWQALRACLAGLDTNEREIISLKFSSQMTNRQIAKVMGISDSNVGVILYRAIRRLRDDFKVLQHE
jgi:RNA polymerase sigma factor (sigma-70 family)